MKITNRFFPIVAIVAVLFLTYSCEKTDLGGLDEYDVSFDGVESVMQNEAMLNIAFIDVFNIGIRAGAFADEQTLGKKAGGGAAGEVLGGEMLIKFVGDNAVLPIHVGVDWGHEKKIGVDGFSRKGEIVATVYEYNWKNKGSIIKITFKEYYYQDHKITGFVTLENMGDGVFNMNIEDGSITSPDGKVAKRDSDLFLKWQEGIETPKNILDDVWHIYGTVDGVTSNNMKYSIVIDEDKSLVKGECEYPTKGVADFTIEKVIFSLNYAPVEEECDNIAEVDFYGKKKRIEFGEKVN